MLVFGCKTVELLYCNYITNVEQFISDIPKTFDSKFKAIILQVLYYTNEKYPNNIQFCEILKKKLNSTKIPYFFLSDFNLLLIQSIIWGDVKINIGQNVAIVAEEKAYKFEYTKNGYKLIEIIFDEKEMPKMMNIQKVLVFADEQQQKFMDIFKSKNPILIDKIDSKRYFESLNEIKKWILDKSYTKNYVIPLTPRKYFIGYEFGGTNFFLMSLDAGTVLPYERSIICPKTCLKYFIGYRKENKLVKHKAFKVDGEAHAFKITFAIDENNFLSLEIKKIVYEYMINFPKFCDSYKNEMTALENYPIIGILANYSFICIQKNGKFEFLESWGGQWGNPMHISFDKKKPQFGKIAEETLVKHGKYGVQNLIKIMSEGNKASTTVPQRGYTFTKDDENPILLEFETFDGTKKSASPEFLMAMLIRQQLKAFEKEMGKKPTKLGFCIFNDLNEKEENNLQTALGKACELMKIKDFCFVPRK
uniref:Uncharacterized protein n=1 Tax=Panagrolaimus davidi TaxID=227884 RepID=A0A914PAZ0_9BILA